MFVCIHPAYGKGPVKLPWAACVRYDAQPRIVGSPAGARSLLSAQRNMEVTAYPLVKPKTAMLHSLCIPGWGQLNNGSRKKAAFFFAAELFCIGGYFYQRHLVKQSGLTVFEREAYKTDRNTFVMYWIVAKILGITDAYVDAQLADFNITDITPEELKKPDAETTDEKE